MSVNLTHVLDEILTEKNLNMKPEDIRYGKTMMGVKGTLRPFTIEGSDTATLIYTGDETPINYDGLWLNTDKTYENIYIENERYTNVHSFMYSNDPTDQGDVTNIIRGVVAPVDLKGCVYVQRGNVVHFFGYYNTTVAENTTTRIHQHYKYDFDTNTWTKLIDTPTPQGLGDAVWKNDYIYIFGSSHDGYGAYVYKYDINNDSYERLTDIIKDGANSPVSAVLGDGNDVYYYAGRHIYKYNLDTGLTMDLYACSSSTSSITTSMNFFTILSGNYYPYHAGKAVYREGMLYHSYRYYYSSSSKYDSYISKFDTVTNKMINTSFTTGTDYATIRAYDGEYMYIPYAAGTTYSTLTGYNFSTETRYSWKSSSTFSTAVSMGGYPMCVFTAEPYDILCCIGEPTQTIAMTLNAKEYDFPGNTLIFYSTTNSSGAHRTQLFKNNKMLNNGRMLTAFNDIHLWEKGETTNTLHKNIETHIGDGTQWVQIK